MGTKQNEIYKKQCLSGGAMISFTIEDNEESAFRLLDSLKLIKLQ